MNQPAPVVPTPVVRDPRTLTLLEVNAHFMRKETFDALVANIVRDGALTSSPLIWAETEGGPEIVLSGNHRTKASIDAGLTEIPCLLLTGPLSQQQRIGIQLSHNSIIGEDDPATLKMLYNEMDDVEWRDYSGLDDKTLELLDNVDAASLSEANLTFNTVTMVFLPNELEVAKIAIEEAKKVSHADEYWTHPMAQYEGMLDALESAQVAHNIGNKATALSVILAVFENHLTELQEGWLAPDGEPKRKGIAPIESITGSRFLPTQIGANLVKTMEAAKQAGDMEKDGTMWSLLDMLASTYMVSVQADREFKKGSKNDDA